MMRYFKVVLCILLGLIAASSAIAQSDHFGTIDQVYLDSTDAVVGHDISVRCFLKNDEPLSIISVPLTYDTTRLTLKGISYADSRAGYIQTKVLTPQVVDSIYGHFIVAFVKISETPLTAGNGLLFTANFAVKSTVTPGSVTIVDSLFFPPGGELMLTENASSEAIRPAFQAGKVVVHPVNRPPALAFEATQSVLEGDSLIVDITASDPDGTALQLACTSKPTSATFTATGPTTGRLLWVPDFVGPFSSSASPIKLSFQVSDGQTSTQQDLLINVVNRNRTPVVSAPAAVSTKAGNKLEFAVDAADPDCEAIHWQVIGLPQGAAFDGLTPGKFTWTPAVTAKDDTFSVKFIGADPQGFADTATVAVAVQAATLYELSIDSASAYPGDLVMVEVNLGNQVTVSGFNVLVQYDPTVLNPTKVEKLGTRAADFETFTVTYSVNGLPGTIRIVGVSSGAGPGVSPLPVGSGAIARITFQTSGDLAYEGLSVPVRFLFNDVATKNDNTLTSATGVKIPQTDIAYTDGFVRIQDIGDVKVGDINLNGLAYEIADVIYFTNHLISPELYPFNILQYANSDINGDNIAATIADLVRLINIVVNGGYPAKVVVSTGELNATVAYGTDARATTLTSHADFALGAMLATVVTPQTIAVDKISCAQPGMAVDASQHGDTVKILMYSLTGAALPEGEQSLVSIAGLTDYRVVSVELASADGRSVTTTVAPKAAALPSTYTLEQNYPNPFNPDTRIDFSLPQPSKVTLTVFDVLGQTVTVLADGTYPAGHHAVTWDGRDNGGHSVASGVYFYRLETGGTALTRKMMFLK